MKSLVFSLAASIAFSTFAQQYSIGWYTIAGGGGTSSNAQYSVLGTIGQADAGTMSGGSFSVTDGFWSLISVDQTPNVPPLTITHVGNNVTVSWPNTGSYTLQQNSNIAISSGWRASSFTIITTNGTNSVAISPPTGNLFFRLTNP